MIADLIHFTLHQVKITDFVIGNLPTHNMLYGRCDKSVCSSFNYTSPHIYTLLFDTNISHLDLSVQRILFHFSIDPNLGALTHWSLLKLFCFLNRGSLIAILPYRPASQSLLLTMDVHTYFSWHWFNCAMMLEKVSLLTCKLVTVMKLSIILFAFGLLPLFLVLFIPVSRCYLMV